MIEPKQFYELIYENTGLKRNNLSESCAELANKHADQLANKVALGFVVYLKEHKCSTLSLEEDLQLFRKKENL